MTQVKNLTPEMETALNDVDAEGLSRLKIVIETARGTIKYRLFTKDAPKTTRRIAELSASGFYDGIVFHRVVPSFVIQGGDPTGTGTSGSGVKLPAEFNDRKHVLGTVSMARSQDVNSADSQFYICLGTHSYLDRQYTVYGQVIEGTDVVQQIKQGDRMNKVSVEL